MAVARKPLAYLVCLTVLAAFFSAVNAADRYWIGSGAAVWSNPANWAATSGCVGPASAPGINDRAFFDACGGNCTLDVNIQVAHLEFKATYSGTFFQSNYIINVTPTSTVGSGLIASGGIFVGSNKQIDLLQAGGVIPPPANFILNGANFTSTSDALNVYGNFIHTSGTFNHKNGYVLLRSYDIVSPGNKTITTLTGIDTTRFSKLVFFTNANPAQFNFNISAGSNIVVEDSVYKTGGAQSRIYNGDIYVRGDAIIGYTGMSAGGAYGTAEFIFDGAGTQRLIGQANNQDGWWENITINKPSGTLFLSDFVRVGPDWKYLQGDIDAGTSTVYFWGEGNNSIIAVTPFTLYRVIIRGAGPPFEKHIGLSQYFNVSDSLTIFGDNLVDLFGGEIRAQGEITIYNAGGNSPANAASDATIVVNGLGDQHFYGQCPRTLGWLPNIRIDKPGGILYLHDTITVQRSWDYLNGNVNSATNNSYVYFRTHGIPENAFIDGEGTGYMSFNTVELGVPRRLLGDIGIKNKLILNSNYLELYGNDLHIENAATNSIQRTTGVIISETSSPPSSIFWNINNASAGTTYTFPFSTFNGTIFYDLTITTAGTPSGTGYVSVATYPTNPAPAANNRPFPPGVTNINNFAGLDNSPRELDRFWVYNCGNYTTTPTVSMTFRYQDVSWNTGSNDIIETRMFPHQWNGTSAWNNPNGTGTIDATNNVSTVNNVTTCSPFTLVDTTLFTQLIFHATDTNICVGETVQYIDDNLTQPSSRSWTFQGGTPPTSAAASPLVTYNTTGTFRAVLWSTYPGLGTLKDTLYNYIVVRDSFTVSESHTNVACSGDSSGTINISVNPSGVGLYTYAWSDGGDSIANRTGLAAGTYTVTVSDTIPGGCFKVKTITITQPLNPLTLTIDNIVNATCTCDGRARANVSDGTGPYTYAWDSSGTTQTSTTLCPGYRSITVTDANGCTISADSILITGSAPLIAAIDSIKNATCNGLCNGTARVAASGGASSYSYSWGCPGQGNAPTASNLCAGPCTVTVTDAASCSTTATAVINQPIPLVATLNVYPISATGADDGRIRAIISGGTLPYIPTVNPDCRPTCSYATALWNQDSVYNLPPGPICIQVFDANLCSDTACTTMVNPTPPLVLDVLAQTDVVCAGVDNGTAWVAASGGTGAYTYSWSRGVNITNDTVTGLSPGSVTVTVTDANNPNEFITGSVTINAPANNPVSFDLNIQTPGCSGSCDGMAWVNNLNGGVTPYSYLWSAGSDITNDTTRNLCAGLISVTVTDSIGCAANDSFTLTNPSAISITESITPVSCPGGSNGAINLTVAGGTGGKTFLWSNGQISQNISGLAENLYSVIVTDTVGCTASESYTVNVATRFEISANVINASCGNSDGSIDLTVLAGSGGSYTYSWAGLGATQDVSSLSAGQYFVTVTDGSCSQALTVTVENSGRPVVTGAVTKATNCSTADGSIALTVSGGSGNYTYSWSNGFNTSTVSNLVRGDYMVTVTDTSATCIAIETFTVGVLNELTMSAAITDANCGETDGSIILSVLTGTGPYTYFWSNGETTNNNAGLGFGTYSVTVTDFSGCTGDSVFTVSEGGSSITGTITHVSCNGGNNGAISIAVGGTNSYLWSNSQTSQNITGLLPGIYTVTVTANSTQCSSAKAFTVLEPAALSLSADLSSISCFGLNDGWIDLNVSGGTPNYTYTWAGPSFNDTQEDITNLAAGAYHITTTDFNSCSTSLSSIQITQPGQIIIDIDTVQVSCGGLDDGQAFATVSGGAPAYTYLWDRGTGLTNDTVTDLTAGAISVTVTDANSCTATKSSTITEPPPLAVTLTKTDISCNGLSDGAAGAHPSGGTPNYFYSWDNGTVVGIGGDSVNGLPAGFVTVTITDNNGCSIVDSIEIIEPAPLTTSITANSVNCFGGSDGTATVVAAGGTPSYTYSWSAGDLPRTNNTVTGLQIGVVVVTVSDLRNCQKTDSITLFQPTALVLVMDSTNNFCPGATNGTATVTVSGGTPNYSYSWSGGAPGNTSNERIQLPAGPVTVSVTDSKNCQANASVNITEPPAIVLTTTKVDISCFGANDGKAFVSASGGTPAYTYLWSAGSPPLTLDSVTGLGGGDVTVTVSDTNSCQQTTTVNIVEPSDIVLAINKLDISCFGLTDGKAWVEASGGTPGFTYSWNGGTPGITPDTTTLLPAGPIGVTVTDARFCTDTASTTIVEPAQLTLSIRHTDVSCFGGNSGTAKVIPAGGTPGYTYNWSAGTPVPPNDSVVNLLAGQVCVTVSDSRLCPATICDTLAQPATPLATTITKTDVSCFGGNDGTAKVVATGGTSGYTYAWSDGTPVPPGDSVRNLLAGEVKVTVTDANLCTKTDSITLIEPADLVLTITVDSNANCNGGTNGGLTVSLTGGTSNYDYEWSNAQQLLGTTQTSHSIAGLSVGIYTVTVTDANSCEKQITENIGERPGPQIASNGIVIVQPTCDQSNGSITINATTQDPLNSFLWNPPVSTTNSAIDLPEGTYNVTITDASTCDTSLTISLLEIPGPTVDFVKIKDSYCDDNDGQATAIVTGGTPAYVFTWLDENNAVISNDSIIDSLVAGLYSLIVADANACDTQINFGIINIASPNAAITPISPQTIFEGQVVELIASSNIPTSSFNWDPPTGLNCATCDTVTANPIRTVTYELVVVDTTTNCQDTTYMTIIVKDETNIFIPNVITPNGDGINDTWNINDLLEVFPDNEVVVINRWGDEVFREKAYGSTAGKKWDGTYKDQKLPDGTYYYLIKLNNIEKTVTGPITVITNE